MRPRRRECSPRSGWRSSGRAFCVSAWSMFRRGSIICRTSIAGTVPSAPIRFRWIRRVTWRGHWNAVSGRPGRRPEMRCSTGSCAESAAAPGRAIIIRSFSCSMRATTMNRGSTGAGNDCWIFSPTPPCTAGWPRWAGSPRSSEMIVPQRNLRNAPSCLLPVSRPGSSIRNVDFTAARTLFSAAVSCRRRTGSFSTAAAGMPDGPRRGKTPMSGCGPGARSAGTLIRW